MRSGRLPLASRWIAVVTVLVGLSLGACKDRNATGELSSPVDASPFESKHRKAFDDDYTPQSVELMGRAPNDVLDQQLFAERLGFSDVLVKVRVNQVFGKGRYEGRKDQYVAVAVEEILIGSLPDETQEEQLLVIMGEDELPRDLSNAQLLLFLKWAPGEVPSYHHHLMPAGEELLEMIGAMVKHAQSEGVLDGDGEISTGRKSRKARKKENDKKKSDAALEGDGPAI
ncbi:MAG: hypothetical protein KUG77_07130 [Nannocystaceae bacterium]|nr:hypothetical protein [Nannocystaceae bacterium]